MECNCNCGQYDGRYVGTDLKFAIEITGEGFDMERDNYRLVLRCGDRKVDVSKDDIVVGEDAYFLCVDTTQFSSGLLTLVVYADVPDEDFDSGIRREVAALDLCYLKYA